MLSYTQRLCSFRPAACDHLEIRAPVLACCPLVTCPNSHTMSDSTSGHRVCQYAPIHQKGLLTPRIGNAPVIHAIEGQKRGERDENKKILLSTYIHDWVASESEKKDMALIASFRVNMSSTLTLLESCYACDLIHGESQERGKEKVPVRIPTYCTNTPMPTPSFPPFICRPFLMMDVVGECLPSDSGTLLLPRFYQLKYTNGEEEKKKHRPFLYPVGRIYR